MSESNLLRELRKRVFDPIVVQLLLIDEEEEDYYSSNIAVGSSPFISFYREILIMHFVVRKNLFYKTYRVVFFIYISRCFEIKWGDDNITKAFFSLNSRGL